jgi:hypothetical protein
LTSSTDSPPWQRRLPLSGVAFGLLTLQSGILPRWTGIVQTDARQHLSSESNP